MHIPFLVSKIHRATVTATDLHYSGSITIDEELMNAAKLRENQKVEVYNISTGSRFATYVITGRRGSRSIEINGAAAHLVSRGDMVIIAAYALLDERELNTLDSIVLILDEKNNIKETIVGKL